jgi:hypothetical protein
VILDSGWFPVGLKKPLDRQLGGLEQFDLFFSFLLWAGVFRQWANSLVVSIGGL